MNENIQKFIDLVSSKLGCGYVWGSQGETLNQQVLNNLINTFGPEHYYLSGGVSAEKWLGKQVFDCSGIIVWALRELGLIGSNADYNTDGLLGLCQRIGSRTELQSGDLVFGGNASGTWHVGVYVGNGYTVQAEGTAIGVVKTTWDQFDSWNIYGRLKCMEGVSEMLKLGSYGADVEILQTNLNRLCHKGENGEPLKVDGDFGKNTKFALIDFQKVNGLLPETGIFDEATESRMDEVLNPKPFEVDYKAEAEMWKSKYNSLKAGIENLLKG